MKAYESLPNYESKSRETTNFIIKSIKTVCKANPSRQSGSEDEKNAQKYVEETMSKFADEVKTQEFTAKINTEGKLKKTAVFFMLSVIIACVSGVVCFLLKDMPELKYLFVIPLILMCVGFIIPSKKGVSENVIAIKNPSGDIKRRIVFMGNINSPVERSLYRATSPKMEYVAIVFFGIGLGLCSLFDLCAIFLFAPDRLNVSPLLALVQLVFIPAGLLIMVFFNPKQEVQGATGNLTGAFDAMAVIQYLTYNSLSLENTQTVSVSCGASLDGATQFLNEYLPSFRDVDTVYISVDTLESDRLIAVSGEKAGLVKSAAENAGVEIKETADVLRSSLIGALINQKVPCARLSGIDADSGLYASREDVVGAISPMAIEAGLKVSLETAYLFDEQGI